MSAEEDFDLSAALLRADGADLTISVEAMANKLEQALPAQTEVNRRGSGLLGRTKHVSDLKVELSGNRYALTLKSDKVQCSCERLVGGISIKREQLGLDEWVAALSAELKSEAERSSEARAALQSLLGLT